MSSYFDYYNENIKIDFNGTNENIKGTCNGMCPQEEVKLRTREHLVHVLEVEGSEKKLVKCYTRSAADATMAVPRLLRPYSVLKNTVIYLLFEVTKRQDVPTSVMYDFLNDRLRSVRQDMTIQRLPPEQCVVLLEPMVRFYVYHAYILRDLPLKDYDPVLNKKHSLECMKWYLSCTDVIEKNQRSGEIEELIRRTTNLEVEDKKHMRVYCDRVLIESLYILCNLDDIHPLYRYISLSKELRREPTLRLSYSIATANHKGNYARVSRLIDRLCPLTYCAVFLYLPIIQRQALQIMTYAYSSRLTVPIKTLRKCLKFSTDDETRAVGAHYGLKVDGEAVRFDKNSFDINVGLHKLRTQKHIEEESSLENIFTYCTNF